jgi:hypothetical protein
MRSVLSKEKREQVIALAVLAGLCVGLSKRQEYGARRLGVICNRLG